jgi:hypothetical protein
MRLESLEIYFGLRLNNIPQAAVIYLFDSAILKLSANAPRLPVFPLPAQGKYG